MRQAFSFYKSFDDTFQALNDNQTLILFKTLRDVQFLRLNINDVEFKDVILSVVWQSIKFSLEKSIKGYLDSQLNSKVKNPYFGIYHPYNGVLTQKTNALQHPYEGVSQQCKEKEEEKEKLKTITIEKEEKIFLEASKNYKNYAKQLYQDSGYIESLSRTQLKEPKQDVAKLTVHKYLKIFLDHLNEYRHVHNTKKEFSKNFSNWLRKQKILKVYPKEEKIRYF